MISENPEPTVQFIRFFSEGRPPQRADRAAGGTLPTRAFRYCEASTTASALGWYVFPPIAFQLYWTGAEIFWTYRGESSWYFLGSAQFPNFRARFDAAAPSDIRGYSPTFLGAAPEPGVVQIWTGLVAKTMPGWSLLVRGPANLPRSAGYDAFEGIIESDRWFGPLFINVRLSRTGSAIAFDPDMPLFQVQPIQRSSYSDETLNNFRLRDLDSMDATEWESYRNTVVKPTQQNCPLGTHAKAVRKQRRAEPASV